MNDAIQMYEEHFLNSRPSLQTLFYDGWVLRFTDGYPFHENSVLMLYSSAIDLHTKIDECEKIYFANKMPVVFRLNSGINRKIDKMFDEKGFAATKNTYALELDLSNSELCNTAIESPPGGGYMISDYPSDDFIKARFDYRNYDEQRKVSTYQLIKNPKSNIKYAQLTVNSYCVAHGSMIVERDHVVLRNILVDESHRGKGYGTSLCTFLLSEAKKMGVHTAILQTFSGNTHALRLYEKLGFRLIYSIWYRYKYAKNCQGV